MSLSRALLRPLAVAGALVAVLAWMPATTAPALAQSAGDEQYADPLVGGDDGGRGQSPAPPPQDTPAPAPSAPSAPATGAAPSDLPSAEPPVPDAAPADSPTLPRTGTDAGLVAAVGIALAMLGLLMRRRAPARAGG